MSNSINIHAHASLHFEFHRNTLPLISFILLNDFNQNIVDVIVKGGLASGFTMLAGVLGSLRKRDEYHAVGLIQEGSVSAVSTCDTADGQGGLMTASNALIVQDLNDFWKAIAVNVVEIDNGNILRVVSTVAALTNHIAFAPGQSTLLESGIRDLVLRDHDWILVEKPWHVCSGVA